MMRFPLLLPLLAWLCLLALPAIAADDLEGFRKRLTGYTWQWKPADINSSFAWDRMEFRADGSFAAGKGGKSSYESTWRTPAAGKVEIMNKDAVGLVLSFNDYWLGGTAQTAAGKKAGVASIVDWKGLHVDPATNLAQDKGGKSATMADLEFILKDYGKPKLDINPRPGVQAYRGPRLVGEVGADVRIPYLATKEEAEKILFDKVPMSSKQGAVAPGFPGGLLLANYDIRFNGFNRVTFVLDKSNHVVCVQMKAENTLNSPEGLKGWKKIERDFHTFDFVRMEERGKNLEIQCFVYDDKGDGLVIVQTLVPENKETTRCYLPAPMIDLILKNVADAGGRVK